MLSAARGGLRWIRSMSRVVGAHPITSRRPARTWIRMLLVQARLLTTRAFGGHARISWLGDLTVAVESGDSGMTGNLYLGLHERDEMLFVLHYLRDGDSFWDGGANVGSYSLLASSLCGADVIAIEPGLQSQGRLAENIALNSLESLVSIETRALAQRDGFAEFDLGISNTRAQLFRDSPAPRSGIAVTVGTVALDSLERTHSTPDLVKLDLEGGELDALRGGKSLLSSDRLSCLLVEDRSTEVAELLEDAGFSLYHYRPESRDLMIGDSVHNNNALWIRNESLENVQGRLAASTFEESVVVDYLSKLL